MTTWRTIAERVAALFPDDPHLPALVAACERDDLALAVYLKIDLFRHLWTHPRRQEKDLHAFLDNSAWPALAADACLAHAVPLPAWCNDWLQLVLKNHRKKMPSEAQRRRAEEALRLWSEVTAPERDPHPDKDKNGQRPRPPASLWRSHAQFNSAGTLLLAVPKGRESAPGLGLSATGIKLNEKTARTLISVFREHFNKAA